MKVLKTRAVATKCRVSESWVRRLLQPRRECEEVAYAETLRKAVHEQPDIALHELKQRYALPRSAPSGHEFQSIDW